MNNLYNLTIRKKDFRDEPNLYNVFGQGDRASTYLRRRIKVTELSAKSITIKDKLYVKYKNFTAGLYKVLYVGLHHTVSVHSSR